MKVQLTYFKRSGKFYIGVEYESAKTKLADIWREVEIMRERGTLPGLAPARPDDDESRFIIAVDVPEAADNHPRLIV